MSVPELRGYTRQPNLGYTLIELLTVLVVIGTMTAIATLSLGSLESDPADEATEKLRLGVELMSNEAIIRSEPLALGLYDRGYAFFRMDNEANAWVLIERDSLLKASEFAEALGINVVVNDEALALTSREALEPQIIAMPTGEVTPFSYELNNPGMNSRYQVSFDALGRVIPEEDNEDAEK